MPQDILSYPGEQDGGADPRAYPGAYPYHLENQPLVVVPPRQPPAPAFPLDSPSKLREGDEGLSPPPLLEASGLELREAAVAREALLRGADSVEIAFLLFQRRHRREPKTLPPAGYIMDKPGYTENPLDNLPRIDEDDAAEINALGDLVRQEEDLHRTALGQKFNRLPEHVRRSFGEPGARYDPATALSNYIHLRAIYYRNGYSDPEGLIFERILTPEQGAALLGVRVIGGLHQEMVGRLSRLPEVLNGWAPDLSGQTAAQIKTVGGFVPRYVAGSTVLSNHAFGLAIDVDADWNPHIRDKRVIDVLLRRTGFNYGARLVEPDKAVGDIETITEIFNQAQGASEKLRQWLNLAIIKDDGVQKEVDADQAAIRKAKADSKSAAKKEDKEAAAAALSKAEQDLKTAQQKRVDDPDLADLWVLKKAHGVKAVEAWAQKGIQTVPLYLAAGMKSPQVRLGWGQEYKHSKDGMHFEMNASQVIPPDSPPRQSLDDLLRD